MVNSSETRNLEGCHSWEGLVLLQLLSRDLFSPAPCSLALSAWEEPVTNLLPAGCCAVDASPSHIPSAALMVMPLRRNTNASGLTFPSTHACQPPTASLSTGEIVLDNILMSWWNCPEGFPVWERAGGGAGVEVQEWGCGGLSVKSLLDIWRDLSSGSSQIFSADFFLIISCILIPLGRWWQPPEALTVSFTSELEVS